MNVSTPILQQSLSVHLSCLLACGCDQAWPVQRTALDSGLESRWLATNAHKRPLTLVLSVGVCVVPAASGPLPHPAPLLLLVPSRGLSWCGGCALETLR